MREKQTAMTKTNIILIMTDHFRRDAVGGSTPHILKLAANAWDCKPHPFKADETVDVR